MSNLQRMHEMRREIDELRAMVHEARADDDIVAELSFGTRMAVISEELNALEQSDTKVGEVAVLFDGGPVMGTSAIDAIFASKALLIFQGIVTRLFSTSLKGALSARGKIKGADLSQLNLKGLATGSFGFVLEEKEAAQASVLKTPVREAMEEAAELFVEFTQAEDDDFLLDVESMNPRVYNAMAKFFKHLNENEATLKTNFPDRAYSFDRVAIDRAYKRISNTRVKIKEEVWKGKLVGLSPVKRTFDFKRDDSAEITSGKFSQQVSQDYLERIEGEDGITLGARFEASIDIATIRKPDGTISISYTVTDLVEL